MTLGGYSNKQVLEKWQILSWNFCGKKSFLFKCYSEKIVIDNIECVVAKSLKKGKHYKKVCYGVRYEGSA